ncbi:Vacuolar protein sorting-associated protein 52 [Coemansia javaensis]|uniref:Vacuolar protein sorting-associated protein 52 n=1 Tax=Coemansia javaensis TaxID=2761396 RepID=A0A9W8HFH7_9FUNG|nr:Vacuolar protein sorting-associated protein 52 [Coemansia javaensis]
MDIVFEGFDTAAGPGPACRDEDGEALALPDAENDGVVRDVLTRGVDLQQHSRQIERELQELEEAQLAGYEAQEGALAELDAEIRGCDEVLGEMERLLAGFKASLGAINKDIQALQRDSGAMRQQLRNRVAAERQLARVVQGVAVAPEAVRTICEGEVNEAYQECLIEVNKKIAYMRVHAKQHRRLRAFGEMQPELERLRLKASARVRGFLLDKIGSLRALSTNAHVVQSSVFLKYRFLNHFLIERHAEAAVEVRDTYIHIMRQYYLDHFEAYRHGLARLERPAADRADVIGAEEPAKLAGLFGGSAKAAPAAGAGAGAGARDRAGAFSLGARAAVLDAADPRAIVLAVAGDADGARRPFEELFRSFNLALVDNATAEYEFITQFFVSPKARQSAAGADMVRLVFGHIFEPSLRCGEQFARAHLDATHDALGVLLCVRIVARLAAELQRRRVPALDAYVNALNMLLWPRFQAILDGHIESIKRLSPPAARSRARARIDTQPPPAVRRYAELTASLLRLNAGHGTHAVALGLARLRAELQAHLAHVADGSADRHAALVFLINSHDQLLAVLAEHGFGDREEEVAAWRQEMAATVLAFAEAQLDARFGYLKQFVAGAEQQSDIAQIGADALGHVAATFNAEWRAQIAAINVAVIQSFSNFRTGTEILHAVLGQLIVYYTRFHGLFDKRFARRPPDGVCQPVGVQNVMVEIKKYRNNF